MQIFAPLLKLWWESCWCTGMGNGEGGGNPKLSQCLKLRYQTSKRPSWRLETWLVLTLPLTHSHLEQVTSVSESHFTI